TGRLPFDGDTPVSVALQHINATPLSPRELNPDIPVGLEEITLKKLEKNKAKYPVEEFKGSSAKYNQLKKK
ncbi:MAG: serine/threonine protein kinase, partial [Firmicutes bacterium]|nr:serine/threonine protein kinase [Bacillota bacterium]